MLQYVVEKFIFSLCWLDTVAITIFPAICAKIQCIRNWKLNKTEMQDYIINDEIKKTDDESTKNADEERNVLILFKKKPFCINLVKALRKQRITTGSLYFGFL